MNNALHRYVPGNSCIHASDARVKFILLLAFSLASFLTSTWQGLAVLCVCVVVAVAISRIPPMRLLALSVPLLVVLAVVWACNAFTFDVAHPRSIDVTALAVLVASVAPDVSLKPFALAGSFGFVPLGCLWALTYALRIELILLASFVVVFTTTSEELTAGFASLLRPLRRVGVPVDDIALVLALTLRFIPQTAYELSRVRAAQLSRGAAFDQGGPWQRIRAWMCVFVPLIVRLFRQASLLGVAMEARCYGKGPRTSLQEHRLQAGQIVVLGVGLGLCAFLSVFA